MTRTSITTTVEVELTVPVGAAWFAGLSDEEMVQFFVEVAAECRRTYPSDPNNQWWHVGHHLAECECSSQGARDMLGNIVDYMRDGWAERRAAILATGPDAPAIDVHPVQ